ncbi:MAG: hypothetical protein CMI09_10630 [Oceanospirillaceae bacterium]|nr:hypothetical protein [Oceanospirillaceae bacterium]
MNPLRYVFRFVLLLAMTLVSVANANTDVIPPSLAPERDALMAMRTPGEGAVMLENRQVYWLNNDNFWQRRFYHAIHVRDLAAARDYGRLSIDFNEYYSEIELEFARVIGVNGQISEVSAEATQLRTTGNGQDFYNERAELVFSLPRVEPGAIIEFQYRYDTRRKQVPGLATASATPYWFQPAEDGNTYRADPVARFSLTFVTPDSVNLNTVVTAGKKNDARVSKRNGKTFHEWNWNNLPEHPLEAATPELSTLMPFVRASTSMDWGPFSQWAMSNYAIKPAYLQQTRDVVAQLGLSANASEEDKLRAVYRYMQNRVRYVYAHLGRGGFTPHSPEETLKAGYGDCKDQTVLTLTLLKALGVEAYPALVETPRAGVSRTDLVSQMFDHILVYLPPTAQRGEVWIDMTGDRARFPGMSQFMQGQNALILDGRSSGVRSIDLTQSAYYRPNRGDMELTYRLDENRRLQAELVMKYSGFMEETTRQWWQTDRRREASLAQLLEEVLKNNGAYQLKTEVVNADEDDRNIEIRAHFQYNEPVNSEEPVRLAALLSQLTNVMNWLGRPQAAEDRKMPYDNPYAFDGSMTVRVEIPDDYSLVLLESPEGLTRGGISTSYSSQRLEPAADGKRYYEMVSRLEVPSFTYSVNQYREYVEMLQALGERSNWLVMLYLSEDTQTERSLNALKENEGESGFEYLIALARHHLDKGDFQAALEPAQAAVNTRKDSGEAWYVLGTAQGFSGDFKSSDASFERAISLGYTP